MIATRAGLLAGLLLAGCGASVDPVEFLAAAADGSAYSVPPGESLRCFAFAETTALRATRLSAEVDRGHVHHVSLHRARMAPEDGDCASFGTSTLLYVWSPGDAPFVAPAGTELVLTESVDDVLVLEIHYLNASDRPVADRSGVSLEVSRADGALELGMWITGVPVLEIPPRTSAHVEERRCEIRSAGPVTLYAVSPHMHLRGVALSVVLERGGVDEVVVDVDPFDPSAQRTVMLNPARTIEPGDTVTVRCVYDNPTDEAIRYGTTLDDEMCFAYFWASPIGLLRADAAFCH